MHQVLVLDIDSLLEGPLIYMSTLETSYFQSNVISQFTLHNTLLPQPQFFFFKVQNFPRVVPPLLLTRKCKFPGGALNQCKVGIYKFSAAAPFHVKNSLYHPNIDQNANGESLFFFPSPLKKCDQLCFDIFFWLKTYFKSFEILLNSKPRSILYKWDQTKKGQRKTVSMITD